MIECGGRGLCGSSAFRKVIASTRQECGVGKNDVIIDMEIQLARVNQGGIIAKKTFDVLLVAHLFADLNLQSVHFGSILFRVHFLFKWIHRHLPLSHFYTYCD